MCLKMVFMSWMLCCVWWYRPTYCADNINNKNEIQCFRQKLDHFSQSNNSEWNQRYLVNSIHYKKDGPVFLFLGAQENIFTQKGGFWDENIKEFKAMGFYLEHRFYGDSLPTNNTSVDNLKFLTSKQALADTAEFIKSTYQTYNITNKSKWVTIGCGLAGLLSAQMRKMYPELVHIAVSSCSQMYLKLDFPEFYKHIEDVFASYNTTCLSEMKEALKQIGDLFETPDGPNTIEKQFKLCNSIDVNRRNEKSYFFKKLAVNIGLIAQNLTRGLYVKNVCDIMVDQKFKNSVDRFVAVFTRVREHFNHKNCMPYTSYEKSLQSLSNTLWCSKDTRVRLRLYQSCTEFGIFQTSTGTEMFGANFPIAYFEEMCTKLFGNRKNDLVKNIAKNNEFNFQGTQSRIIYVSGTNDGYFNLSFKKHLNYNTEAIVITVKGMTHCQDLLLPKQTDSLELKQARKNIKEFIQTHVKNDNEVKKKDQKKSHSLTSQSKKKSSNCFTCGPDS